MEERKLLQDLFIWRLAIEKLGIVVLGIDTMVMDNDRAKVREGVSPTYKRVKGFQPLQVYWNGCLIDTVLALTRNSMNNLLNQRKKNTLKERKSLNLTTIEVMMNS